ncbi:MAG: hypothetical protein J6P05_02945 [Lachnospiraceae bacterium]|nr:hypothetical protein [Lachnospiraceae bacterium]
MMGKELKMGELDQVSGGFREDVGYADGLRIICPNCGNTDRSKFERAKDRKNEENSYKCLSCGHKFRVDEFGFDA